MKTNLGYDMRAAEKVFFDTADGMHILHLVEVFARDGIADLTRQVGDVPDAGELWMLDEDGFNEATEEEWEFEGRETVGFERAELEAMEQDPS